MTGTLIFPVSSAKTGFGSASGSGSTRGMSRFSVASSTPDRIDFIMDLPRIGIACELLRFTRSGIARIKIRDVALGHAFKAQGQIPTHQVLDDIVEALPALCILAWCAHQLRKFYVR